MSTDRAYHLDMAKRPTLSETARKALIDIGTNRQGAMVSVGTSDAIIAELMGKNMISTGYGLTRAGSIERQRLYSEALDAL